MRPSSLTTFVLLATITPVPALGQDADAELPVVTIDRPTVILFWTDPESVQDPEARMGLYSALDQQQTTMADTRPALNDLGMVDVSQPGRRFRVRDGVEDRVFSASPDSSVVGYLFAAPGRDFSVRYRVQFTDALLEAARAFLGGIGERYSGGQVNSN